MSDLWEASLNIESKGDGNYLFTSEGCHLQYFVIWYEGCSPEWIQIYGDGYYYQLNYKLEKNKIYKFHVYDGNDSKDFRGKMMIRT